MNEFTRIELRKERDFGQLISATFEFIKAEFKMLMRLMFYIAGPLILVSLLINIPASIHTMKLQLNQQFGPNPTALFGSVGWSMLAAILQGFAGLLFVVAINEYIRLYEEGKTNISINEVWAQVKKNFWMYFGAGILLSLMIGVGIVLLIVPGIYLSVALSFVFIIITMEQLDAGKAISRSFDLIKGNWWSSFGYYIVIVLIEIAIVYTVALPLTVLNMTFLSGYIATGAMELPLWYTIVFSVLSVLSVVLSIGGSVILYVGISFKYFSIVEHMEQTGLKKQIEHMGVQPDEE